MNLKRFRKHQQRSVLIVVPANLVHQYIKPKLEKAIADTEYMLKRCGIPDPKPHMGLYSFAKEYNMRAVSWTNDRSGMIIELMAPERDDMAEFVLQFLEKRVLLCNCEPYIEQIHFDYDTQVVSTSLIVAPFFIPN